MSELSAYYFDGRSAERHAVIVRFTDPEYLTVQELGTQSRFPVEQLKVRERVAGQPAVVDLPGGARLEVRDAEVFYQAFRQHTGRRQWQYGVESRSVVIATLLALVVVSGWLVYSKGVPRVAEWVAYTIPEDIVRSIGAGSLQSMDNSVFMPSKLRPERRQRIRAAMEEVSQTVGGGQRYMLQFRDGDGIGANAFAFPSGVIVFTDDMVRLAASNDELRTIMAHEIGHIRNRHGLRLIVQKSLLAGLAVAISGDVAAVGGLAVALPRLLVETGYTREFEYEADEVAKEYLVATGKPLTLFRDIMLRLTEHAADRPEAPGLLRSHPAVEERIQAFLD